MAFLKKTKKVDEPVEPKAEPKVESKAPEPVNRPVPGREPHEDGEYPDFKGDARQGYVDINNPSHGNKTYEELQKEAE